MSRGEERRHNYVITTLANTRDVKKKNKKKNRKQVMRRQRRRHSKVFILSADLHKAKKDKKRNGASSQSESQELKANQRCM